MPASFGGPAGGAEFAKRLCVARRDIEIFVVAADEWRDFPRACALLPLRKLRFDGDAGDVIETEGAGWPFTRNNVGGGSDTYFGDVDSVQRRVQLIVGNVD